MFVLKKRFDLETVSNTRFRKAALLGTSAITMLSAQAIWAQETPIEPINDECNETVAIVNEEDCTHLNAGTVVDMPLGENEELETFNNYPQGNDLDGFSISIDGQNYAGDEINEIQSAYNMPTISPNTGQVMMGSATELRAEDIALYQADVQVRYDGLDIQPMLNVATTDLQTSYLPGEPIVFQTFANYPAWIRRAEILIYDVNSANPNKPIAVVNASANGTTQPLVLQGGSGEYQYVLRVYDAAGRYDETRPLPLAIRGDVDYEHELNGPIIAAGVGEDNTAKRNIPVDGGTVTVYGENARPGSQIRVMGENVPVDNSGKFVIERIMPHGVVAVAVDVNDGYGPRQIVREVEIPNYEWFYVIHGDATYHASLDGDDSDTYGRFAGYTKGRVKGGYVITGAIDTGEGEFDSMFSGVLDKSTDSFLDRLDPDDYYPVFGDDSTMIDDAPSRGKIYVRVEKDNSYAMWGNFQSAISGNSFVEASRSLYGAQGVFRSNEATSFGEARYKASAYYATADTRPQKDVFLGTGGSTYFLQYQDINIGSDQLVIETRDPDTGRVTGTKALVYGEDYRFDYIQGVVILSEPLSRQGGDNGLIRGNGDEEQYLVVNYEFSPTFNDVEGNVAGARGSAWLTDQIEVGVSAMSDDTEEADYTIYAADVTYRHSENTYIKAEYAQSRGVYFSESISYDGGLSITRQQPIGQSDFEASAFSVTAFADVEELFPTSGAKGSLSAYVEQKEAGFIANNKATAVGMMSFGAAANIQVNDQVEVLGNLDRIDYEDDRSKTSAEIGASYQMNEQVKLYAALGYEQVAGPNADDDGERLDLMVRGDYQIDDNSSVYAFAQGTASVSGNMDRNDRYGIGGKMRVTDRITVEGEVSTGTTGEAASIYAKYEQNTSDYYYFGYRLDPDRLAKNDLHNAENGEWVFGAHRQISQSLAAYAETSYDLLGKRRSYIQSYGVTYSPSTVWGASGLYEYGVLEGTEFGDIERHAFSASLSYNPSEDIFARYTLEYRNDDAEDPDGDRNTLALSANGYYQQNPDWRLIASVDAVISTSNQSSILDGEYVESSIGYAYRPVDNERLNALFKYTYLYDNPGPDQLGHDGESAGFKQRSHIISGDFIYDLNEQWSIGAKYGYRMSEFAPRGTSDFETSTVHLAVVRADYHLTHEWDMVGEVRTIWGEEAKQSDFGALFGVYRHFGNNFKIGVGYDYGSFSDDLRDFNEQESGVFINAVAKF